MEAGTSDQLNPEAHRREWYTPDLLRIAVLVFQIGNLAARPPLPPLVNGIPPPCVLPPLPCPPVDLILGGLDLGILDGLEVLLAAVGGGRQCRWR